VNKNASGGDRMVIDGSAHSCISLFEIYMGSTQLEYVRDYSSVVQVLMDSQAGTDRFFKNGNILEGMHATALQTGDTIDAAGIKTYCVSLVSGIIGSMVEKMLLVGAITRDNMKVSITLADKHDLTTGASVDWEVTDLELVCEYVMINDTVARVLEFMKPIGICIPFTTFSLQRNNVPTGVSSVNMLLSGNFRSVKTLFTIFRLDSNKNAAAAKYFTDRSNPIKSTGKWAYDIVGFKVP
jgi:hypothetical protein